MRALVLLGRCALAMTTGEIMIVPQLAHEALAICREAGEKRGIAYALQFLGGSASYIDPASARRYLDESLELGREIGEVPFVFGNLVTLGHACQMNGELAAARSFFEEALTIFEQLGPRIDPASLSAVLGRERGRMALTGLGLVALAEGRLSEARDHLEAVVRVAPPNIGALQWLSETLIYLGEYRTAREYADEALQIVRESPERSQWGEEFAMGYVTRVDLAEGNAQLARETTERSLRTLSPLVPPRQRGFLLVQLAEAELYLGEVASARQHLSEGQDSILKGPRGGMSLVPFMDAKIARAEGKLERAETSVHEALALQHEMGYRIGIVRSLELLGSIAAAHESFREAARLCGAAASLREDMGWARAPIDRGAYEAELTALRGVLGDAFDNAWVEGRGLSVDEAVAYASRGRGERKRPSSGWASLTPTQLDVANLVGQGLTNAQIAERLFVSRSTVKYHLSEIFSKLGVSTRTELASIAARHD